MTGSLTCKAKALSASPEHSVCNLSRLKTPPASCPIDASENRHETGRTYARARLLGEVQAGKYPRRYVSFSSGHVANACEFLRLGTFAELYVRPRGRVLPQHVLDVGPVDLDLDTHALLWQQHSPNSKSEHLAASGAADDVVNGHQVADRNLTGR